MATPVDCISITQSSSGELLAAGRSLFTGRYWTGYVSVCKTDRLEEEAKADLRAGVAAVAWLNTDVHSSDAAVVVTGSDDGSIDLWEYNVDKAAGSLRHLEGKPAHDQTVSGVAADPGGHHVASASWDLQVRIWDATAFLDCTASLVGHTDLVHAIAWGPDSGTLFSAAQDKTVLQWDPRNSSCASVMRLPHPVCAVACCTRSHRLVAGDEAGGLTFFDTRKLGMQLANLKGLHHDAIKAIAFPPSDSKAMVASSGDDGRICIIPEDQQISAVKQQVRTPHQQGAYIRALAYGSKGLYSGGWDGSIEYTM